MTTVTVRDVRKDTWQRFKAKAAAVDLPLGKALDLAVDSWIILPKKKGKGEDFFAMSVDVEGPDAEHISEKVDEIVYS